MRKIFFVFMLFVPSLYAESELNKTCISPSGKSIYQISLSNEINSVGQIVLRFDNQINFYSAKVKITDNDKLVGVSKFLKSETGQTQGSPWIFTYDYKKNVFIDDGRLISPCN